ncbi:hypothetical protein [Persicobacter diffluens]|uniref:DUF2116 family Zn-ribbon domain-containing protein n=1 Tax=Persicobacter diffluens TaxID=981 RepID=A0AAN4W022_9BACT|nr:hypothetical protein PEDI_31840 [Persicobacter diffluens]
MADVCLYCQAPILVGRADRKYCDSKCRSAFHNQQRKDAFARTIALNKLLMKNRNILKKLSPEGKGIIRKEVLLRYEFSFEYFTNLYLTQKGHVYYFCYEYGFCPILEKGIEKLLIVKWQDYMANYQYNPWKKLR